MINPQQAFLNSMAAVTSALQHLPQSSLVRNMMPSHIPVEVNIIIHVVMFLVEKSLILKINRYGFSLSLYFLNQLCK